ncbi:hypothetical protein FLL46_01790 [Aliikangiella coralliicola]|uniref:Cardiolipin synthase N-terminal domain-containing protein n=1 Tax=Aliikangiella coralliicola TaxID=2592383 RepID=A0A545UJK4_9GAMM|nr:hypothetical protein FLL46_01790 [Aliikangiella coralliicola]
MGMSLFILLAVVIWLLPFILVLTSNRTSGSEKVAWLLGIVFISWFVWIFYLLLAPLKPKQQRY